MRPHRILIVDDHPLVREWLANLIRQQPDLTVCSEAEGMAGAIREIERTRPDVVIVDISLEDGWGLDLIRSVSARSPDVRIIVLSMHDEKFYAERAIRAGAQGYIMKRETAKNVVAAIRSVLAGKLYLSAKMQSEFAQRFVGGMARLRQSPIEQLSDRELEVFQLLGRGLQIKQVASRIGISLKTVHTYCARIREKLQLETGAELLREAIRCNDPAHL